MFLFLINLLSFCFGFSDDKRNGALHDEKGRRVRRSIPVRRGERGEDVGDGHDGVLDLLKSK